MGGPTVAVNAAVRSGGDVGGVEQFVIGLVDGLTQVNEDIEFLLVTDPGDPDWIAPYTGPRMRTVQRPPRGWHERLPIPESVKDVARPVKRAVFDAGDGDDPSPPSIPDWGEFVRDLGADMIYFPFQDFAHIGVPSVYNPHDLQHHHYPEFFSPADRRRREHYFEAGCTGSVAVDVPSRSTKEDVVSAYGVAPEDVYVIPRAPPVQAYEPVDDEAVARTRRRHDLPERFAFYPAQTWPHRCIAGWLSVRPQLMAAVHRPLAQ